MQAAKLEHEKTIGRVVPNAGVEAWYRRQLELYIERMARSVSYWLIAAYRQTGMAADALGPDEIADEIKRLGKKWDAIFDVLASRLAAGFTTRVRKHADDQLSSKLRVAGFGKVRFQLTRPMREGLKATLMEQINLIKSIPSEYLTQVSSMVMVSASLGRDVGALAENLKQRYHVAHNRANTIARDQNNKATATMTRIRQTQLGIKEGRWHHSHAGKTPRPAHVRAHGKKFNLQKGMLIDGEYILPGQKINCRCTWEPIIPGFEA